MSNEFPGVLGWQGLLHGLPAEWEPVGMYGSWRKGHILLAEDRRPRLAIAWERRAIRPDLERTLKRAANAHRREAKASTTTPFESCGSDGVLTRLVGGPSEIGMIARRMEPAGVTVIYRQLGPGAIPQLRRLAQAGTAVGDDESARWAIHGLDVQLPPYWRSEGIQILAGFVRAVWFHYPHAGQKVDQVLVIRRYACATHLLAGRDLATWLSAQTDTRESVNVMESAADHAVVTCSAPGRTPWRRWRGRREERHLIAWIDRASDRLTVQETIGGGEPLPGLRPTGGSPRCAFLSNREATGMP